eukprot:Rhum_TRINITY_DN15381_c7_g1::Rhum_TRINITY_DN15381_c7_g1_i2::g.154760::m.154760
MSFVLSMFYGTKAVQVHQDRLAKLRRLLNQLDILLLLVDLELHVLLLLTLLPVPRVVEDGVLVVTRVRHRLDDSTRDGSAHGGERDRREERRRLHRRLVRRRPGTAGTRRVHKADVAAEGSVAGRGRRDRAGDTADQSRDTVEVEHAARVVDARALLEGRLDDHVSDNRHNAGDEADQEGRPGVHDQVAAAADRDTARERGVLDVDHRELAATQDERHEEGARRRRGDRHHRVDHDTVPGGARGERAVERRPEHEQEQRAHHREGVRGARAGRLTLRVRLLHLLRRHEHARRGHSEDGTEQVDVHRATHVHRLVLEHADRLVQAVHDDLEDAHHQQLRGTGLAEEGAERDEHRRRTEVARHQAARGDVDAVEEAVALERLVPEAEHEDRPLQHEGRDQHVERHGRQRVLAHERHQEAEADEHHHVDVLPERVQARQGEVGGTLLRVLALHDRIVSVLDQEGVQQDDGNLEPSEEGRRHGLKLGRHLDSMKYRYCS